MTTGLRILRICQDVPYPPDDGVRIEPFHSSSRMAARGHEMTIVGFMRGDRDVSPLREWCNLHVVPFRGYNSIPNLTRGVIERRPVNYMKYREAHFGSVVQSLLEKHDYHVVIVDYSAMGWYAFEVKKQSRAALITRWHNVDTLIWERWSETKRDPIRGWLGRTQTGFVRRFESELAVASDLCLTVGARDTELLKTLAPEANVEFLPPGIDVDHYTPAGRTREPHSIVLLASDYCWHPNYDAAKWLCQEIMPQVWREIPDAKVYMTGRNATSEMKSWTKPGLVELTGFVPDDRDVIAKGSVLVVPMRLGGGVKLKVLTAFASAKAVVTTTVGAEGIPGLKDGQQLLIRDESSDFADAITQLLRSDATRESIERAGHDFARRNYSWDVIVGKWECALRSVTESHAVAL